MDIFIPIIAILSTIALPIATGLILGFKKINSEHKERMGLIQQGIIPPIKRKPKVNPNRYNSLRNGVVLVAIGVGITVGIIGIETLEIAVSNPFMFTTASTLLFLGIGYLVFYLILSYSIQYSSHIY